MANLIAKPQGSNASNLNSVASPVPFSSAQGLAILLAKLTVGANGSIPYVRNISAGQFRSGLYEMPLPSGWTPAPFTLPVIEPYTWAVGTDTIKSMQPVQIYNIGSNADRLSSNFPISIPKTPYVVDGVSVLPLELFQKISLRIFKTAGVGINWASGNVANNGLTDAAIKASTELILTIVNIGGTYTVSEWISPNFVENTLSSVKTTAKDSFSSIINEIYDKLSGAAGGDLTGSYPNPTLKDNAVTTDHIQDGAVTTSKIANEAVLLNRIQKIFTGFIGNSGTQAASPKSITPGTALDMLNAVGRPSYDDQAEHAIKGEIWNGKQVYGRRLPATSTPSGELGFSWNVTGITRIISIAGYAYTNDATFLLSSGITIGYGGIGVMYSGGNISIFFGLDPSGLTVEPYIKYVK